MKLLITIALLICFSALAYEWEALSETAPVPADNLQTREKIALGKQLFLTRGSRRPEPYPATQVMPGLPQTLGMSLIE